MDTVAGRVCLGGGGGECECEAGKERGVGRASAGTLGWGMHAETANRNARWLSLNPISVEEVACLSGCGTASPRALPCPHCPVQQARQHQHQHQHRHQYRRPEAWRCSGALQVQCCSMMAAWWCRGPEGNSRLPLIGAGLRPAAGCAVGVTPSELPLARTGKGGWHYRFNLC